jgi:hypothetical protein
MPRSMPRLDVGFSKEANRALELAQAGVRIRVGSPSNSVARRELTIARLEALYETSFLRTFLVWETFLEQSFYRYLCGHVSALGGCVLINPAYATITAAETAVLGGNDFVSWANPTKVVKRAKLHMTGSFHELVLLSDLTRLGYFTSIRNRIAHPSDFARNEFDKATRALALRRYPGSSAGRFLRDRAVSAPVPKTWLEVIADELMALAHQICA